MEWEYRFCPHPDCVVDFWLVQPSQQHAPLWHLTDRFGERHVVVAASEPICPSCGSTLCDVKDQHSSDDILKPGALYDFVRSLS